MCILTYVIFITELLIGKLTIIGRYIKYIYRAGGFGQIANPSLRILLAMFVIARGV